jgi:hypothetical protein
MENGMFGKRYVWKTVCLETVGLENSRFGKQYVWKKK